MPSTRHHSHDLNFKLKIIAEAKAFNKNCEIAHEYSISESMVRKWCNQQHVLFLVSCGWQQSVYPCNATNWRTRVGYYITEQVLLRTYANFCLFPFLQKLINVLKAVFSFWFIGIKDWIRCNLHYTSDQKALLFLLILSTFSVLFFSF